MNSTFIWQQNSSKLELFQYVTYVSNPIFSLPQTGKFFFCCKKRFYTFFVIPLTAPLVFIKKNGGKVSGERKRDKG